MKHEKFGTKWGFVLATAGSAIGLGNVWRFPYLVGEYGGFSFIFMYLLMVVLVCAPLMMAEISLGRVSRSNMIDAYRVVGEKMGLKGLPIWTFFGGWLSAVGITMIASFYFLVAGWVIFYLVQSVQGSLLHASVQELQQTFSDLSQNFGAQYFYGMLFLVATAAIVLGGVKKGIERASLVLMPLLFVIFVVLAVQSMNLVGAEKGVGFLFQADWRQLGVSGDGFEVQKFLTVCLAALGQAFLSLSLGFGLLVVYGSYMPEKENLFKSVGSIALFDSCAAILSAVIIIPAVFAAGLPPSSGPGLTFVSLPVVFGRIANGQLWGTVFYVLLVLATVTSTISIFEGLVNLVMDKARQTRRRAVAVTFLICTVGFTTVTASFSGMWQVRLFGRNIFELFDWLTSTFLAAIVSLTIALFVGYKMMKITLRRLRQKEKMSRFFIRYLLITLRIFAPLALIVLLAVAFYNVFSPAS